MSTLFQKYKEIILYIIFGGFTTLVNILVFSLLNDLLHWHYLLANAIAWLASVIFAFFTNRKWVFESTSDNIGTEFIKFTSCRLLSGGCDMGIMYVGVDVLHIQTFIMKLLTNVVVVIMNYVFSKLFIFTSKESIE